MKNVENRNAQVQFRIVVQTDPLKLRIMFIRKIADLRPRKWPYHYPGIADLGSKKADPYPDVADLSSHNFLVASNPSKYIRNTYYDLR
jgi:hypothetical protein